MLFIRGPDQAHQISDPDLRDLVALRFLEIVDGATYDPEIHGEMIVVEPGDNGDGLEKHTGCSIFTNPFDGSEYGDEDFVPLTEWIAEHPACFEMLFLFSDDGAGVNVFIPKSPGIDAELLPLELSDDAAAILLDFLHDLTAALERHYAGQLLRRQQTRRQSRSTDLSDGRADTDASR